MVVTWEDFIEQMNGTNHQINEMSEEFVKMKATFESLSSTYQGIIDYCEKNTDKKNK